jgi:hypothetical protein
MQVLTIKETKYFKVIEVFGKRFINVKRATQETIKINGEVFYVLSPMGNAINAF